MQVAVLSLGEKYRLYRKVPLRRAPEKPSRLPMQITQNSEADHRNSTSPGYCARPGIALPYVPYIDHDIDTLSEDPDPIRAA